MKRRITLLCLIALPTLFVTACGTGGNESKQDENEFTVTFKCTNYDANSGIWENNTYSRKYKVGDKIYEPKYPSDNFAMADYSLTNDFSSYSLDPDELNINSDKTVFVRYFGKIACQTNLVVGGYTVGKFLPNFNENIYKLPSIGDSGVYMTTFRQKKDEPSWTVDIDDICKGHYFDGWYEDENYSSKLKLPYEFTFAKGSKEMLYFYGKIGDAKAYSVSVKYYYRGADLKEEFLIEEKKDSSVKYLSNLKDFADDLPSNISSDYVIADETSVYGSYFIKQNNKFEKLKPAIDGGWVDADNMELKVYVRPVYEGYFLAKSSTNNQINNKYLPTTALSTYYYDDSETIRTTTVFGSSSQVSYKLSDINSITFPLTNRLPSSELYDLRTTGKSHYPNLTKVDFSQAKYITSIPANFFNNCPNLETVIGTNLPHLNKISDGFLSYCSITDLDVDFSSVTEIDSTIVGFLHYAFSPLLNKTITIDLSSLKTGTVTDMLCHDSNTGKVILYIGEYTGIFAGTFMSYYPRSGSYSSEGYKTLLPIDIYCSSQANATLIASRL